MHRIHTLAFLLFVQSAAGGVPPYAGPVGDVCKEAATGFFRTEQIDGRWWVIDPRGGLFYIVGTDHARFEGHGCEKLGYAPYGKFTREKYGSEEKWAESTIQRLVDWGFNTLSAGHSPSLRHRRLPHIEFLAVGQSFARKDALCPQTTWTGFPNVFSPDWPAHCDAIAREKCLPARDDPWLIGYFLDNELEWYGKAWLPGGLFDEAWKLPAEHTGKQAWVAYVKRSLGEPAAMETHFGLKIASFEELAGHTSPARPLTDQGREWALGWAGEVAEQYFRHASEAIRRHDPNHMVLGCRFAGPSPRAWAVAGKHCDVVSFNYYPDIDVGRGVPAWFIEKVTDFQREANAPMMITEWSFPALDTPLPSTNGAGMRVDNQEQRARCFEHFQSAMFRLPFMVGSNYFMYVDEPALGISEGFPENSNYGLINERDGPYAEITQAAAKLNPQAIALHRQGPPATQPASAWLEHWMTMSPDEASHTNEQVLTLKTGQLELQGPIDGHAWQLRSAGTTLGHFHPLMQQLTPHTQWEPSRAGRITGVTRLTEGAIVDMEFDGGTSVTRISALADRASSSRPARYRSAWRFFIPADALEESNPADRTGWLATKCRWVQNVDDHPWTLAGIFHYLSPAIGGSADGDQPLNMRVQRYYRRGEAWIDPAAGLGIGCWLPPEMDFYHRYWKDEHGQFHADVHYDPYVTLQPGERYEQPGPIAFFFPFTELTREGFAAGTRAVETAAFRSP